MHNALSNRKQEAGQTLPPLAFIGHRHRMAQILQTPQRNMTGDKGTAGRCGAFLALA